MTGLLSEIVADNDDLAAEFLKSFATSATGSLKSPPEPISSLARLNASLLDAPLSHATFASGAVLEPPRRTTPPCPPVQRRGRGQASTRRAPYAMLKLVLSRSLISWETHRQLVTWLQQILIYMDQGSRAPGVSLSAWLRLVNVLSTERRDIKIFRDRQNIFYLIEVVMANIVMLFLCLLVGVALRVTRRAPENAHLAINAFIIHISLPALIIGQIHKISISTTVVIAALMPWFLFATSALVFFGTRRLLGVSLATTGALTLSAGLANTSFVGLPMIETFYGTQGLSIGILIDQLGTYLVLSTLGIAIACLCSGSTTSKKDIALRIAKFPPFIALLVAIVVAGLDYPLWLTTVLHRLGDTLAPLALVSVGLQLRFNEVQDNRLSLVCGLAFKLVVGPAIIALIYLGLLWQSGESTQITLFEAAMGPQIGGAIVAIQYGLNPALVTLMVGLGITASFVTLPVWWYVLRAV